jgi:hypothetical protein
VDKVCGFYLDRRQNRILTLTERSKKQLYTETNLDIISFKPYSRKTVDSRRDLEKILFIKGNTDVYFSTFTGEMLRMDDEFNFYYLGPSFEGSRHGISPSGKKTAAFIDGRLFVLDGPVMEDTWKSTMKRLKSK